MYTPTPATGEKEPKPVVSTKLETMRGQGRGRHLHQCEGANVDGGTW